MDIYKDSLYGIKLMHPTEVIKMETTINNIRVSHYKIDLEGHWHPLVIDYRIPDDLSPLGHRITLSNGLKVTCLKTVDGREWNVFTGFPTTMQIEEIGKEAL